MLSGFFAALNLEAASAPSITAQPQRQTNFFGSNVLFTVTAAGQTPLFYQWSFDGTNLTDNGHVNGSTTTNLTVNNITTSDAGNYRVVVTNSHGSATSAVATLTVLVPAMVTAQPTNESVLLSNNVTFTSAATGTPPLAYQWYFNGTALADGGRVSGSGTANLTIFDVQTNDAGPYQLVVTNNYRMATSAVATLMVLVPPAITSSPTSQSVLQNSNVTFTALAIGTAPLNYQWYFNGSPLVDGGGVSGSATADLNISNAQTNDAGSYQLVVTNNYGLATSALATLTVLVPAGITVAPSNEVALLGGATVFSAVGSGTGPLFYQWQKDGVKLADGGRLSGTGSPALSISNIQMSDAGNYSVTVSNSYGAAATGASLLVEPVIGWGDNAYGETTIPEGFSNAIAIATGGEDPAYTDYVNLALKADGTVAGSLSVPAGLSNVVQVSAGRMHGVALRSDGTVAAFGGDISGQTNVPSGLGNVVATSTASDSSIALKNDGTAVGWGYTVMPSGLSNLVAVSSGPFSGLAIQSDDTIIGWGYPAYGEASAPAGLSNVVAVSAGGYHNLALKSDGTVVAWGYNNHGQTDVPAGLSNVIAIAAGFYHSLALKSDGTVVAWGDNDYGQAAPPAGLTNVVAIAAGSRNSLALVQDPETPVAPDVLWQGATNRSVPPGQSAIFLPVVTGSLPMNFQWFFNNAPLPGQTNRWLLLSSFQSEQVGTYQFVVSNSYGSATSQVATVEETPEIVTQPTNESVLLGSNASFSATALYVGALNYQWYFNGTALSDGGRVSGSTTSNLNIADVQTNDAGSYQLVVTNDSGSATSVVAVLTVLGAPTIATQPAGETVSVNASVTFSVVATSGDLAYQWQKDGVNLTDGGKISGAASANLTVTGVLATNAGIYQVVVSNPVGAVTSGGAVLNVVPVAIWGDNSSGQTDVPASATNIVAIAVGGTHVLALRADGSLVGWGDNSWGQISIPADATNIVAIAAGELGYSLAVRDDGTVLGWGYNIYGEASPSASATNVIAVSAHTVDGMGLRGDGTAVGWGYDDSGITDTPAFATNLVALCLGSDFDIGLRADGQVVGWGYNDFGAPVIPAVLTNALAISAGWLHALALSASGTVVAWGNNGWGQTNVPVNATNVIALAGGHGHSLALRADGTVVGWGDNSAGQLSLPPNVTNVVAIGASGKCSGALLNDPSAPIPPRIGRQPPDANAPAGGAVVLHAVALGSLPMLYQWLHQGALMPGQTNAWLALRNISLDDTGGYQVVASNGYGSVTSQVAVVAETATFTAQPTNEAVLLGSTASLSAAAVGSGGLNFQWYYDGAPMSDGGRVTGSTTGNLTIANVQTNDAGMYQLVVTNEYGAATSAVATLTVLVPAAITASPTNETVLSGSNVTFSVSAIGTAPLSYSWYSNGTALTNGGRMSGANSNTLTISNTQTNDSAVYQAIVTNLYGMATSSVATLTVVIPVKITGQPSSQAALLGTNVTFAITASGSGPLSYQWYFNGTALVDGGHISGSATPALTISNVQSSDAGGYAAVVTNILSSARSFTASLTPQATLGPSTRYVALTSTNPMPPYLDWSTAATNIQDAVDAAVAGDSILVSNGIYNAGGGRVVYGAASNRVVVNKAITVQSVNGPLATTIEGFLGSPLGTYHPGRCVYLTNGASLVGFSLTNGGTPSSGDLVREKSGGAIWCETAAVVSNCAIAGCTSSGGYGGGVFGGTLINCELTNNSAFYGGGAASNVLFNCALVHNVGDGNLNYGGGAYGCVLSHCLLVGNLSSSGGGAAYSTLTSCVLSNNSATAGGGLYMGVASASLISSNRAFLYGGGAFSNVLNNCVVKNNFGARVGGGIYYSDLTNCTVVSNSAASVGGVNGAVIVNSIVYDNAGANIQDGRTVLYTCTIPGMGTGGITNAPLFVNEAAGDLHLQSNSPCINSGNNAYVTSSTDFDGNPRIVGGTVDMGAYEYQTPTSVISYAWLQQYGLPTDGSVDYADLDGTGFNVYQDWIAGLNPTNSASVLAMQIPVVNTNSSGLTVSWSSVNNRTYYLQRATNLAAQPAFSTIQSNIAGQAGTTSFPDTTATNGGPYFYRVGVQQ